MNVRGASYYFLCGLSTSSRGDDSTGSIARVANQGSSANISFGLELRLRKAMAVGTSLLSNDCGLSSVSFDGSSSGYKDRGDGYVLYSACSLFGCRFWVGAPSGCAGMFLVSELPGSSCYSISRFTRSLTGTLKVSTSGVRAGLVTSGSVGKSGNSAKRQNRQKLGKRRNPGNSPKSANPRNPKL